MQTPRFAGKVALITGASDRGIGGAIAERLGEEGAALALLSRTEPARLRKKLDRLGVDHCFETCDVTQPEQTQAVIQQVHDRFTHIDVLVNNAGVELARPFEQFSAEERHLLEVNLLGAIQVTHAAVPYLINAGGVIINIASALALGGCPGFSIYSASKAGLIGFTQSLAWELAPRGVRVVGVAPGLVLTPMIHKHREHLSPEVQARIDACHPLGVGMPRDVASAVAFLASDDARWITGVTLPLGWAPHYPLPTAQFLSW